ncbi:hypothetical protein PQQ96_37230 [Paraburkholderia sediminicola]|uniref:hypothetical protein n=1 Tax=Paraburkholderia sediminicola TaxID=458836 RepID=UPI0038BA1AFE
MLLALTLLVETMRPTKAAPALRTVLDALAGEPVLNAAIACLLTWAAHSSTPVVLFVMHAAWRIRNEFVTSSAAQRCRWFRSGSAAGRRATSTRNAG